MKLTTHLSCILLTCATASSSLAQKPSFTDSTNEYQGGVYKLELSSLRLDGAVAQDVATILNEQFPEFTFSADSATNHIYFRAPDEVRDEVSVVIAEIEENAARHRARIEEQNASRQQPLRQIQPQPEPQVSMHYLKFTEASAVEATLLSLGMVGESVVTVAPSGNALLIRGPQSEVAKLVELIEQIDREPPQGSARIEESVLNANNTNSLFALSEDQYAEMDPTRAASEFDADPAALDRQVAALKSEYGALERLANQTAQRLKTQQDPNSKVARQLRDEIESAVAKLFAARQRLQSAQIGASRARLQQVERRLAERQRKAAIIIQRRVEELTGQPAAKHSSSFDSFFDPVVHKEASTTIEALPELDVVIVRGDREKVEAVVETIDELKSDPTQPDLDRGR